jgi:predicted dehydrogenase
MRYAHHLLAGDVPAAKLTAVHRRDATSGSQWAQQHHVRYYESLDALIAAPEVELVVVVLPPARHPSALRLCAAAGKPVLVEKPLGVDPEETRLAVELTQRASIPAMVAQTLRYNAIVVRLRELIAELGEISLIAINQRFEPIDRTWLDQLEHGGLIFNTGIHGIDLARYLVGGRITRAVALRRVEPERQTECAFASAFWLEPGHVLVTLDNTRTTSARSGRVEICGSQGQLIADHVNHYVARVRGNGLLPLSVPEPVPTVRETLRAFVDAVLKARPVPIPLVEGLAAVEAAAMIRRACADEPPR